MYDDQDAAYDRARLEQQLIGSGDMAAILKRAVEGAAAEDVPARDRAKTIAHLIDTVQTNLGHGIRHLEAARAAYARGDHAAVEFNMRHSRDHLAGETLEHVVKLVATLRDWYPAVGSELDRLHRITQAVSS
jgi:hypothetical protein